MDASCASSSRWSSPSLSVSIPAASSSECCAPALAIAAMNSARLSSPCAGGGGRRGASAKGAARIDASRGLSFRAGSYSIKMKEGNYGQGVSSFRTSLSVSASANCSCSSTVK